MRMPERDRITTCLGAGRVPQNRFMQPDREAPTLGELLSFAATLPPDQAERLLARARPAPLAPDDNDQVDPPPPVYNSWGDYLKVTSIEERLRWCRAKAKIANRTRLMSGMPERKVTPNEVWTILEAAEGRCAYCGSLAVERRPSGPDGRPIPWAHIGRRIGSLGHRLARFHGGANNPANLCWSCLWCNTWPTERRPGATDHGGFQSQR
jgi:hypothetical protein